MSSYTDFQPAYGWIVKDTFVGDLKVNEKLSFEGTGVVTDPKSLLAQGGGAKWGTNCNYTSLDTVTAKNNAKVYTIRRYPTYNTLACFPPGKDPIPWPEDGKWSPATGASWTAQEGSGTFYPQSPAGDESYT